MKDKISNYIEKNQKWLIERLFDLIAADTINHPPSGNENNGQLIIEETFRNMGLEIDRFNPDDVPGFKESKAYLRGRDYTNRDNIVGAIGEGEKKTIIFNGHIDVVPSHQFDWKVTGPFEPKHVDGKIYGLGSLDMKGGIVAYIYALKTVLDLGITIKGKVILESALDEEFGGANGSLACVMKGYVGDFAIIPEPTFMSVCVSNLSSKVYDIIVKGSRRADYLFKKAGKMNAILLMSKVICALQDYEDHLNSLKWKYEIYKDMEKPINFMLSSIKAGEVGIDKINCFPEQCMATVYLLNYPEKDNKTFNEELFTFLKKYPDIKENLEDGTIVFNEEHHRLIEGGNTDINSKKNRVFIDSIIENGKKLANRELQITAATFGNDFFTFSNYGNTPVVVFGPGGDNVHAPDEYVLLRDLLDLSKIFAGLIYDFCC
ncbi:MAG: M20/M25/M40 family metallo-hydrolase [Spirochaetota bacterium]